MNISWLSLDVNILNNDKIKLIRKLPAGSELIVLWIGLLCLAMKAENTGRLEMTPGIPYSPEDIASLLDISLTTVKAGIAVFASDKFRMVEITERNTIEIINFFKYQQIEKIQDQREKTRLRVSNYRKNRKLLTAKKDDDK